MIILLYSVMFCDNHANEAHKVQLSTSHSVCAIGKMPKNHTAAQKSSLRAIVCMVDFMCLSSFIMLVIGEGKNRA